MAIGLIKKGHPLFRKFSEKFIKGLKLIENSVKRLETVWARFLNREGNEDVWLGFKYCCRHEYETSGYLQTTNESLPRACTVHRTEHENSAINNELDFCDSVPGRIPEENRLPEARSSEESSSNSGHHYKATSSTRLKLHGNHHLQNAAVSAEIAEKPPLLNEKKEASSLEGSSDNSGRPNEATSSTRLKLHGNHHLQNASVSAEIAEKSPLLNDKKEARSLVGSSVNSGRPNEATSSTRFKLHGNHHLQNAVVSAEKPLLLNEKKEARSLEGSSGNSDHPNEATISTRLKLHENHQLQNVVVSAEIAEIPLLLNEKKETRSLEGSSGNSGHPNEATSSTRLKLHGNHQLQNAAETLIPVPLNGNKEARFQEESSGNSGHPYELLGNQLQNAAETDPTHSVFSNKSLFEAGSDRRISSVSSEIADKYQPINEKKEARSLGESFCNSDHPSKTFSTHRLELLGNHQLQNTAKTVKLLNEKKEARSQEKSSGNSGHLNETSSAHMFELLLQNDAETLKLFNEITEARSQEESSGNSGHPYKATSSTHRLELLGNRLLQNAAETDPTHSVFSNKSLFEAGSDRRISSVSSEFADKSQLVNERKDSNKSPYAAGNERRISSVSTEIAEKAPLVNERIVSNVALADPLKNETQQLSRPPNPQAGELDNEKSPQGQNTSERNSLATDDIDTLSTRYFPETCKMLKLGMYQYSHIKAIQTSPTSDNTYALITRVTILRTAILPLQLRKQEWNEIIVRPFRLKHFCKRRLKNLYLFYKMFSLSQAGLGTFGITKRSCRVLKTNISGGGEKGMLNQLIVKQKQTDMHVVILACVFSSNRMCLRWFEHKTELFAVECFSQKDSKPHLGDKVVAGFTDVSICTAVCSECTQKNVLELTELNVGSSGEVSGRKCGKQLETGRSDRKIKKQTGDMLTDIKRDAVGPDESQLIKSVPVLLLYERKRVSFEEFKRLDSESPNIFLHRETEVHTKEEMRLERGPQYKLAVVTAEGFEDAWRQSLVQENSLEYSNYFPRDSKMIVGIPVYRLGFINRSDRKRQKDKRYVT